MNQSKGKLAYIINVDWYFSLHWLDRARAAVADGFEVHLLTSFTDQSRLHNLQKKGFICHSIPLDRKTMNPFRDLKTFFHIVLSLKSIKPDIVHCITVKPNIYGGIAARFLGIKSILNITGLGLAFSSRTTKASAARQVITTLYKQAANRHCCKIIFENNDDRNTFLANGIGRIENFYVIPGSGVDTNLFRFLPEKKRSVPIMLFAARMLWDKGLADVVEAGEILTKKGIAFRLDVAGIIDESSQNAIPLSQIQKWHEAKKLNWLGEVKNMPELLSKANVVVLPSSYGEGVPRVLIEAASVGRAIVTTDVTGCRDIVQDGENGFLVEPHSPHQLADALEKLLGNHALRQKFGRKGRAYVEQVFNKEHVVTKNISIYNSFLGSRLP